jgi:carbon-monoxide dehydrogenase small subunit
LIEGKPMKSCLILAQEAHGRSILTVEGLMDGKNLSKLQEAFIKKGAVQCGFCTSAFLLMGHYLLSKEEQLSRESIKDSLNGILCRCTGYSDLIESIYEVYLDTYK